MLAGSRLESAISTSALAPEHLPTALLVTAAGCNAVRELRAPRQPSVFR